MEVKKTALLWPSTSPASSILNPQSSILSLFRLSTLIPWPVKREAYFTGLRHPPSEYCPLNTEYSGAAGALDA